MSKGLINKVLTVMQQKAPELLLGTGITGMVTTVILSVRGTVKAVRVVDEAKKKDQELKRGDVVKLTWKYYILAAITGAGSVVCLIFARSASARRNAALAAACSISETALREYREKVVETIGEKKEEKIRDAVAQDRLDANPVSKQVVFMTGRGDTLFYDYYSGHYFMSDVESIRRAANSISRRMIDEIYCSLNDFYDEIGLKWIPLGDEIGFNINRQGALDPVFPPGVSDDERPCLVVKFRNPPTHDYRI